MKTYKNDSFTVVFTDAHNFTVTNKFGDTYKCRLDEEGRIVSSSRFGLQYAMKARKELNF